MLDGFLTQEDHARGRRIFCFVRTFLAPRAQATKLTAALRRQSMRGRWLPEKPSVIYTYAGEIPWCETFPNNGFTKLEFVVKEHRRKVRRKQPVLFLNGKRFDGLALDIIRDKLNSNQLTADALGLQTMPLHAEWRNMMVESEEIRRETNDFNVFIPVCDFGWEGMTLEQESLHSPTLAKELTRTLQLTGIPESLDSTTRDGTRATYSIAHRSQSYSNSQKFFFIREDLLRKYLQKQKLALIFVAWGECELGSKAVRYAHDSGEVGPGFKVFHTVTKYSHSKR